MFHGVFHRLVEIKVDVAEELQGQLSRSHGHVAELQRQLGGVERRLEHEVRAAQQEAERQRGRADAALRRLETLQADADGRQRDAERRLQQLQQRHDQVRSSLFFSSFVLFFFSLCSKRTYRDLNRLGPRCSSTWKWNPPWSFLALAWGANLGEVVLKMSPELSLDTAALNWSATHCQPIRNCISRAEA